MGLLTEISCNEKKPVIEPPGEPQGVVAETAMASGEATTPKGAPEKISCSHLRTKKILLVGNDPMGVLNWGDVTPGRQCLECGAVFSDGPGGSRNGFCRHRPAG
jgi:hypothetical protein